MAHGPLATLVDMGMGVDARTCNLTPARDDSADLAGLHAMDDCRPWPREPAPPQRQPFSAPTNRSRHAPPPWPLTSSPRRPSSPPLVLNSASLAPPPPHGFIRRPHHRSPQQHDHYHHPPPSGSQPRRRPSLSPDDDDAAAMSAQPMGSLVGKLRMQTLAAPTDDGSVASQAYVPPWRDRAVALGHAQDALPEAGAAFRADATSASHAADNSRMPSAYARRILTGASGPGESVTAPCAGTNTPPTNLSSLPSLEVEPAFDPSLCQLEADEGFVEGPDEMAWLADDGGGGAGISSRNATMHGQTHTVRSNHLLTFRTSAEAAMRCSVVVRKNPRMRRRRQKKLEARSKTDLETTTAAVTPGTSHSHHVQAV